ncbi:MAG: type IV pilus assembly protein PilO [Phycisphaerales bacterium]|jgi:type IV pilus assembly protein PilO
MRLGPREMMMLLGVLMIPAGAFMLAFKPQNTRIQEDQVALEHMKEMLDKLRVETAGNDDLEATNSEIATQIDSMESRLPTNKEIDEIIRQVSVLAADSGLGDPTLKTEKPVAAAAYREQPLTMSVSGTWDGFYRFMQQVERLPRITRVVKMTLERDEDLEIVEVEFQLSIYFRQDEEANS